MRDSGMRVSEPTRLGPLGQQTAFGFAVVDAVVASSVVLAATGSVLVGAVYAGAILAGVTVAGAHRPRLRHRVLPAVPVLVASVAVAALAASSWLPGGREPVVVAGLALLALVVHQVLLHLVVAPACRRRQRRRTLVVGAGHVGVTLAESLGADARFGLVPVGFIDDCSPDPALPLPLLGAVSCLGQHVRDHGARDVIIAFGVTREVDLVEVVRQCEVEDVRLWLVPRLFELSVPSGADRVRGVPLVPISRSRLHPGARMAKRSFDLAVSATLLVLGLPVLVAVAAIVRASSPGPVLFRQERVGQYGRPISLLKFRTMRINEDSRTTWSVRDDSRVTGVGRILRRTSLDELPQLFNVLKGDLSVVGPRPERPHFVEMFSAVPGYQRRLRMPMGMTGLAQISGLRGDTSISERVFLDNQYIENWSFWGDVRILLRTFTALIGPPEQGAADGEQPFGPARLGPRQALAASAGTIIDLRTNNPDDGSSSVGHMNPAVSLAPRG